MGQAATRISEYCPAERTSLANFDNLKADIKVLEDGGHKPVECAQRRYCFEAAQVYMANEAEWQKVIDCLRLFRVAGEQPRSPDDAVDFDMDAPRLWCCCPTVDDEDAADEDASQRLLTAPIVHGSISQCFDRNSEGFNAPAWTTCFVS